MLPEEVERLAAELDHLTVELGDTRQEAAMRHSAVSDTLSSLVSVPTDIEGLHRALESVGADLAEARADAASGIEAAGGRIDELQSLPADVEGMYRELDRLAEAHRQRGEDLAELEARTASLESLAELRADVDRVAADLRSEVERVAAELRGEFDTLGGELAESKVDTAGRLDTLLAIVRELERLPADVGALYRELERLDDIDRRRGEQLAMLEGRIAPDDMAKLHVQLEAATVAIRNLETIPAEVEGLYRELDRLTELNRERTQQLADIEQRIVPREAFTELESELHSIASDLVGTAEALQRRLVDMESLPAAVDAAFQGARPADSRRRRRPQHRRARARRPPHQRRRPRPLPADIEGLYRELHRIDEDDPPERDQARPTSRPAPFPGRPSPTCAATSTA